MVAPKRSLPLSCELRRLGQTLCSPAPYAIFALALLILALAYQVRPSYHLEPGKTDGAFWSRINDKETDPNTKQTYRWTTDVSILTLPGVGGGDYRVRLTLNGARPAGRPSPHLIVRAGDTILADLQPAPTSQTYDLAVPAAVAADDLQLVLQTPNAFLENPAHPEQGRRLGIVLYSVDVIPVGTGLVIPPLGTVLPLALAAVLPALLLGMLGGGAAGVRVVGLGGAAVQAGFLLADRLFLTPLAGLLPVLELSVGGLLLVLGPLWRVLYHAGGITWSAHEQRGLLGLFATTWVIRLAGQLHPQIQIIDLLFHQHRFDAVLAGNWLFTIPSEEWGGRQTFYLPTPYIFMLPLQALLHDELLTIRVFTVTLDTLGVFFVYYLAKRAFSDGRAGLFAAVLSVTFPIAILPFSWGITANLFGQTTGLAALALIIGMYDRLTRLGPWLLLTAVLTLALLSHPGSVQLTGVTVAGLIVAWAWQAWHPRLSNSVPSEGAAGARAAWGALVAALVVAMGVAWFGYYQHFAAEQLKTLGEIQAARAAEALKKGWSIKVGGEVNDASLGLHQRILTDRTQWVVAVGQDFVAEAWAYFHTIPLLSALLGFFVVRRSRSPAGPPTPIRRRMLLAAAAWATVVVAYAIIGAVANLYVRYPLFLAPLIALGVGLFLSTLWDRGYWGRLFVATFMTAAVLEGLMFWYTRILYANK